jgi:hypothetical protein
VTSEWAKSDAWVAKAIARASAADGAVLSQIIGEVDALNHLIVSRAEVEQAVRRLCGTGLLVVEGKTFRLTADGEAVTGPVEGGLFSQVRGVLNRLERIPVLESEWKLDDDAYAAAVEEYREGRRQFKRKRGLSSP